jgi:hypothetical protein
MVWGKAGSTTLSSTSDTITVSGMTASKTNQFLNHAIPDSNNTQTRYSVNGVDTGGKYSYSNTKLGQYNSTGQDENNVLYDMGGEDADKFSITYACDVAGEEKLFIGFGVSRKDAGSGSGGLVTNNEIVWKYETTSARVTSVKDDTSAQTGTYAVDSNLSVLGSEITTGITTPAVPAIPALMPSLQSPSVGGWVEVGRTTLGSAGTTIDVSGLADKRYYMVLHNSISTGNVTSSVRLNGDSGNNYAWRYNDNGTVPDPTPITNNNAMNAGDRNPPTGGDAWAVSYLANKSGKEKLMYSTGLQRNTAGSGTAPTRGETASKWTGTDVIDQITSVNQESGNWSSDSEMVVLGWDPSDTHTTNFWEELASVESTSASNSISTGTFTAKKYLWVQCYVPSSTGGADNYVIRVGNSTIDDQTNYSQRYNINGGANGSGDQVTQNKIRLAFNISSGSEWFFANSFIVNNPSSEKLLISHATRNATAGAGTAPSRYEMAGKWANTSNQIDIIELLHQNTSSSLGAGSIIKVWGAN